MSETDAISSNAPRRKKTSRTLFEYTGKAFSALSKENPTGLHKAAVAWLTVLQAAAKPLDRDECLALLAGADTGTTQQPIRIIYYWKKTLIDGGWVRLTRKDGGKPKVDAVPTPETPAATVPEVQPPTV